MGDYIRANIVDSDHLFLAYVSIYSMVLISPRQTFVFIKLSKVRYSRRNEKIYYIRKKFSIDYLRHFLFLK